MGYYMAAWQENLVANKLQNTEICGFKLSSPQALYTSPFMGRKVVVAHFGDGLGLSFQQDRRGLDPLLIFDVPNRGLYGLWDEQWSYIYDPEITTEAVQASFNHLKWLFEYSKALTSEAKEYMKIFSTHLSMFNFANGFNKSWNALIDDWALLPMSAAALLSVPLGKLGFKPMNVNNFDDDFIFWVREPSTLPDTRAFLLRDVS